jgi:outer membrane protein assembly factor BamB
MGSSSAARPVSGPHRAPVCQNFRMSHPSLTRLTLCTLVLLGAASLTAQPRPGSPWPHWRGPAHTGVAETAVPLTWSDAQNLRWKIEVPGRGFSTPVVAGDRLFLTTAIPTGKRTAVPEAGRGGRGAGGGTGAGEEHRLEVIAVDRATGKVAWRRTAATVTPHEGYHRLYGSFASNAPATDGERVYAFFGSHGLYAYDVDGNLVWQADPGIRMNMRLAFGEGSGVVLDTGRIYLQYDHQGEGAIVALRAADGQEQWRAPRDDTSSWSTPLVVEHAGRKQLVVTADTKVRAYDVDTGKVVWEVAGLGMNPIPQPVQFRDTVIVMTGFREPRLMAVRLGRTGDLTGTDAVVWETTRGTSYTASPALHDGSLYVFSDNGLLSVFDAATGEPRYLQARLPKPYANKASPLVANGRVYLATEEGDVVVVAIGPELKVLATNTLSDQAFIASPIAAGDTLYLRSRTHLFAIAER